MAFNTQQASRARAAVLIAALVIVAGLAAFVVMGGLAPATSGDAAAGATGTSSSAGAAEAVETVDAQYGTAAQALLAQYEQDPTNPTTLLNVANGYFDWGVAALNHATDDEGSAHATELLNQAVGYYDDYLADNPEAKSAMVDRAICVFYAGDHASAIAALESAMGQDMSRLRNYQRHLVEKGLSLKAYPFSKIIDVDHAEDIMKAESFLKS